MAPRLQRLVIGLAFALGGPMAGAAAPELRVVSAAPQGVLEGDEQQRIQLVFSAAMVPLGEAAPMSAPPSWLSVAPPLLARWRWAGTAELIGEPLAPLPGATHYRVTAHAGAGAAGGAVLAADFSFDFTTPLPRATGVLVADAEAEIRAPGRRFAEDESGGERELAPGEAIALLWNQPVDLGSVAAHLAVTVSPRPLEGAEKVLSAEQIGRLKRQDAAAFSAWQRFLASARGAASGAASFTLRPHPKQANVVLIEPVGCWPRAALVAVELSAGVRSLEGVETAAAARLGRFTTPYPLAPLRVAGRTATSGKGLDPDGAELNFSTQVTWRDLVETLTFREVGEKAWRRPQVSSEQWLWDWENEKLDLEPLALTGGREYEVCVAAGARDAFGDELDFPWCSRFATGHRAPQLYFVEGDGVVEWNGPHVIPLRALNVTEYRAQQRRLGEDELVAMLKQRQEETLEKRPEAGKPIATRAPADRSVLLPIDLERVLAGAPGIVLSSLRVSGVTPSSEYDSEEAGYLRRPRTAVTQVTSLGLAVKASGHEGMTVWVTSLADASPVAGALVVVRDETNHVLWQGSTDASGLVRTSAEVNLTNSFLITARHGDDLAYARTQWWEGHRGWEFNLPVDDDRERPVVGEVWPDRGVVRPGEGVHLKAVLRRLDDAGPHHLGRAETTFVVRDPRGDDALVQVAPIDAFGAAEIELAVPEQAALGSWSVLLGGGYDRVKRAFAEGEAWDIAGRLRVAEFRRPKFRVLSHAAHELVVAGDPVSVGVEGQLLAGGPMSGAATQWTVRASRWHWRPAASRWSGWEFEPDAFADEGEQQPHPETIAQGQAELDAAGRFEISLPRAGALKGWPAALDAEAEVRDVDRQSAATRARVRVLPATVLLGVERPPFFVNASDGVTARLVALSAAETPVAGVALHVELQRRHWDSVRRREVSGRYVFESRPVVESVAAKEVVSGADPVAVSFALAAGGEYAIVASGLDERGNPTRAAAAFYVFGEGFTPWRMDRENRIELVPERDAYAPGETARVLVKSPWERTTALVTVERAGVIEARVEDLSGTMPVLTVPVLAAFTPNVYVSVVLLRGRVPAPADPEMTDPGRPAYRVGYCELTVPPRERRLAVAVTAARAEYRPGQQAQATVQVTGADGTPRRAGVTLWAVDAGVLELTGYRTPDLIAAFYARHGLGVSTADSRSRLVGRRSYGTKGAKQGGGGGVETAAEVARRDFRALAVWRGDVETDASGRATIAFTLPDSLTTYRLMAVATAGEAEFGNGESELIVTKPLGLEPALPRFLRPDDSARAGVVVRNRTKVALEVEVALAIDAGAPVKLRGSATRVVTVPAGGSSEVGFGLVARTPGSAVLRFAAVAGGRTGERDSIEVPLRVVPVVPVETAATFFTTAGRAEERVAVPADVFPDTGGLELTLSSSALVEVGPAVRWLAAYPYSCAEQASSRLLGLAAARRLGAGVAPASVDGEPIEKASAREVARLAACQRSDGGFGFWPGATPSLPALSAHVAWALAEAARAGVAVEPRVLEQAASYLSQQLRRETWPWGEADGWTARALASFALVKLGKPEPAYFQWLFDTRERGRPEWGRALLAATIAAVDRNDPRVGVLVQEVRNRLAVEARAAHLEEPVPDWGWWVFWGAGRDDAAALLAQLAGGDAAVAERLVRGILDRLGRDRERTTHDTAWMLQALAAWRETNEAPAGARSATATLAGDEVLRAELTGNGIEVSRATVPMAELSRRVSGATRELPLVVEVKGNGEVHAAALLSYASRRADRPAVAQGLVVGRRFLLAGSEPVAGVRAGEEVVVEVVVSCPATRRFVAVEVPLPAGLEALDTALATTRQGPARDSDSEGTAEDEEPPWSPGFDRVELRDDRVVLFATELPAGDHTYRVRCRATTSGHFAVAPAHGEEMYAPEVFATTPAAAFEVFPPGR
jgi:alpha-2-macroglobulin